MTIGLVWAQAHQRVIGRDNTIPWHVPEDLKHFKEVTGSGRVVMGRRTWESLPEKVRPLPGRVNIVVTRRRDWAEPGAQVAHSVQEALRAECAAPIWVMGGAEVYAEAIAHADVLEVTEIDLAVPGDVRAPAIGPDWLVTARSPQSGWHESAKDGTRYRFLTYRRR